MAGFSVGSFMRVWEYEDKGKYGIANCSVSQKNKDSGAYETKFSSKFVRFVGNAHTAMSGVHLEPKKGVTVKLSSCEVQNVFTKADGTVNYTPNFVVFGFEFPDGNNVQASPTSRGASQQKPQDDGFMQIPDGVEDDELPFN